MRVCHCILGKDGRCCQDRAEKFHYATGTSSSGSTYTYGLPRRVRKSKFGGLNPWIVTNHPAGPMSFRTWREAMDFATSAYWMMVMNSPEPIPAPPVTGLYPTAYC